MTRRRAWAVVRGLLAVSCVAGVAGCGAERGGEPVEVTVPRGASFAVVVDSLAARGIVGQPRLFRLFARLRGADRAVHAGRYALAPGSSWAEILSDLTAGRVLTESVTVPEGFTLRQIAERLAPLAELEPDAVLSRLSADPEEAGWDVPASGLEGYLFPDTYHFAPGVSLDAIVRAMLARHRAAWTAEREIRVLELGMTQHEAVTMASIIQAEARKVEEMSLISAVYHNRLKIGYPLQADPTVLYALGGPRPRLLFAAIDSVASHPYNTYTNPGLPPGPIGAPGDAALEAAVNPAAVDFLYFVARPDGSHIFTRSLQEHNRARIRARQEWDALQRNPSGNG